MIDSKALPPLEAACKVVNGTTELARLLSGRRPRPVSKASVSRWKKDGVPAEVCPDIEDITGIKCEALRPDINWAVLRNTGWNGAERRKQQRTAKAA